MRLRTIAFSNLWRRKARSAFLIVGLLIGVGTVVALLALTQSLTGGAQADLQSYGANIVITPQSKDVALDYGGMTVRGGQVSERPLREADLARIAGIPARGSIAVVAPELVGAVRARGHRVLLLGVRPEEQFRLKRWWSLGSGRPPADGHELVAGAAAAEALHLQMGDYVTLGGRRFTLTGVLRPTGAQDDHLLIADLGAVQKVLGRPGELTLVEVAATYGGAPVARIVRQLSAALPEAKVAPVQEAVQSRLHAVDAFRGFSYAIVGIVVAIEALVVFLTVMGSVSERTHEIGVFRAIGFRRVHITRLILVETVTSSVLAGLLGYAVGMALAAAVLPRVAQGTPLAWAPLLGVVAVALAVLVGGLASLYPALHAGKMDPTEALRAL